MESDEVIATGLLENTVYDVNVEYKLNGELCKSNYKASTNMYDPGEDINPTSKGFNIGLRQSDENLITSLKKDYIEIILYKVCPIELAYDFAINWSPLLNPCTIIIHPLLNQDFSKIFLTPSLFFEEICLSNNAK